MSVWLLVNAWMPVGREIGREKLGKWLVKGACVLVVWLEAFGVAWAWEER